MSKILLRNDEIFVPKVLTIGARDFVRRKVFTIDSSNNEFHLYLPKPNWINTRLHKQIPFALLKLDVKESRFDPFKDRSSLFENRMQIEFALSEIGIQRNLETMHFRRAKLDCPETPNGPIYHIRPALIIN